MTIAEQIELILSERKKKSEMLKTRKEELMKIKLVLRNTNAELGALARNIADDELRKQYIAVIKGLETTDAENEMDRLIRRVNNGIKRFDREQLSIATVGKERQGKSKFLQSVGALDNNIIPAYDATSCTGATSIIWNTPTMAKGTVRAVITFRQPDELMEIVKPYIMELDPNYLKERKLAFEDIGDLKSSYFHPKEGDERQASAMEHLMSIVDHFDEIQHLFGSSTITLTDPELIKTYVAQNNGLTKYKDADYEEYHNWIAVKRADIYCPFYTDVGRLRLVDTVGIGDTKYGIEEMMLHTVDQECDAAIVVTKPISGIQQPDQALYRSLRERFELRNTSLWLFYLVNHHVGQNDKTVASFEQGVKNSRWSVADCRIVDSSNPDTVRDDFQFLAGINLAVAGPLVGFGPFGNIVMVRIFIKVPETIPDILIRIVLKPTGDVAVEMDPVFPIQEEHADADEIRHILVVVGMIQMGKLFRIFFTFADDFLQKMVRFLSAVAVGMDAGSLNIVQILINKGLSQLPHGSFQLPVLFLDPGQLFPADIGFRQIHFRDAIFC